MRAGPSSWLFLVLIAVGASAQDASLVPSIQFELATANNDTLRADALARLCSNLIHSEPDSARYHGNKALELATRIGQPRAMATPIMTWAGRKRSRGTSRRLKNTSVSHWNCSVRSAT